VIFQQVYNPKIPGLDGPIPGFRIGDNDQNPEIQDCNHLAVYQVANRTVSQAVLATDGLTRFGGTTTSHPPTSEGMPSIMLSVGIEKTLRPLQAKR